MTDNEKKPTETKPKERPPWAFWIASAFSGLTVVLLLLGYGARLGIESNTGIPHASMIDSPADLIELSSIPLMELLTVFGESLTQWISYERLVMRVWLPILGLSIFSLLMFTLGYLWRRFKNKRTSGVSDRPKSQTRKPRECSANSAWKHWKIYLQLQAFLLAVPVILLSGVALVFYCVALVSIIPIFGMQATTAYFKNWVVAPEVCIALQNNKSRKEIRDSNKKINGVSCVNVTKDDRFLGTGRVVLSTSKTIVLYSPKDGSVRRIPLEGAVIELVAKLPE